MSETPAEWAERRYDEIQGARQSARDAIKRQRDADSAEEYRRACQAESAAWADAQRRGGPR